MTYRFRYTDSGFGPSGRTGGNVVDQPVLRGSATPTEVVGRGVASRRAAGVKVSGAAEAQDANELNVLLDHDQPPPTCRRCGALPDAPPTVTHSDRRARPIPQHPEHDIADPRTTDPLESFI
jgi:hypothetical protein